MSVTLRHDFLIGLKIGSQGTKQSSEHNGFWPFKIQKYQENTYFLILNFLIKEKVVYSY